MLSNRMTATLAGVLFIIGTVAGILSVVFTNSPFTDSDYLREIAQNDNQVMLGAVCVLIMGFALALVPLILYPIFKKHHEILALGYLIFRGVLEAVAYMMIVLIWFMLVALAHESTKGGDAAYFQSLGNTLMETNDWIAQLVTIVFSLGGMMLYYVFYQTRLIPRWLSGWGLIFIFVYMASALLALFNVIEAGSETQTLLQMPIAFQEMVMALWMIFKGFAPSAAE